MRAPIFVDTNVFVYARDASERAKQPRAAAWIEHLWRSRTGRTSVQVLSEYYVTVTRKLVPGLAESDAWDDVKALLSWRPCVVDATLLAHGRELTLRHRLAWWDGLVVAAAEAQGCALLLSEDFQDGATYANVTVRSPFTLEVNEADARYAPVSVQVSDHPSRGRPKRPR